ncbi:MAG: hypothetical protein VXX95_07000 [Candidatus Thermoplasmatota archaeon]|nr:hypothetical protein [Candidatus Thermoplasmatota archaeon]
MADGAGFEPLNRLLGFPFLPEAKRGIGGEHDEDENRITWFIRVKCQGEQRRTDQEKIQRVVVLVQKAEPCRVTRLRRQSIEAVSFAQVEDLCVSEAIRAGFQLINNMVRVDGMPRDPVPPFHLVRKTHVIEPRNVHPMKVMVHFHADALTKKGEFAVV